MTKKEREALAKGVLREIANWSTSRLSDEDQAFVRSEMAEILAVPLGITEEESFLWLDVARMTS